MPTYEDGCPYVNLLCTGPASEPTAAEPLGILEGMLQGSLLSVR